MILVLLLFVVLIDVLSFNLLDDRSQWWSLTTQLIDVIVSFISCCVLWLFHLAFQRVLRFLVVFVLIFDNISERTRRHLMTG